LVLFDKHHAIPTFVRILRHVSRQAIPRLPPTDETSCCRYQPPTETIGEPKRSAVPNSFSPLLGSQSCIDAGCSAPPVESHRAFWQRLCGFRSRGPRPNRTFHFERLEWHRSGSTAPELRERLFLWQPPDRIDSRPRQMAGETWGAFVEWSGMNASRISFHERTPHSNTGYQITLLIQFVCSFFARDRRNVART
jgi:hypothetical protein